MPADEFDQEEFDQKVDDIIEQTTESQTDTLVARIATYYKAGSDTVRDTTGLTNVQKNAIKKISADSFGYLSEFNGTVGEQIKEKARDIYAQEKGYAELSTEIKKYAEGVFDGSERIVINNVGKTRKVIEVGKDGTLRAVDKVVTRPYVTNVQAYSDMLSRTATHTAWEQGRASEYQEMGFTEFRIVGPVDERSRPSHCAVLGIVYKYGSQEGAYALSLLEEPNCRHSHVPIFGNGRDTPMSFFEEQKKKAGLYWDDSNEGWFFSSSTPA